MKKKEISCVIITNNRKNYLHNCIKSILKQNYELKNIEIIIVNDHVHKFIKENDFKFLKNISFKIINNNKKRFMAECRNIGAMNSIGKYILFIDDDNLLEKNLLKNLVFHFKKNKMSGVIGPTMYDINMRKYLSSQKINLNTSITKSFVFDSFNSLHLSTGVPNVFMIPRKIFNHIRFNSVMLQTYSEPDFSLNLYNKLKLKSFIADDCKVYHQFDSKDFSRQIGNVYPIKAYCLMRNRAMLIKDYGSLNNKLIFSLVYYFPIFFYYCFNAIKFKQYQLLRYYLFGLIDGFRYMLFKILNHNFLNRII